MHWEAGKRKVKNETLFGISSCVHFLSTQFTPHAWHQQNNLVGCLHARLLLTIDWSSARSAKCVNDGARCLRRLQFFLNVFFYRINRSTPTSQFPFDLFFMCTPQSALPALLGRRVVGCGGREASPRPPLMPRRRACCCFFFLVGKPPHPTPRRRRRRREQLRSIDRSTDGVTPDRISAWLPESTLRSKRSLAQTGLGDATQPKAARRAAGAES